MKVILAVLLLSAAAFAQQSKNPVTDVLRDSLAGRQKNTVAAIDEMPAEKFGFKPTPDQMSFGHLATHIVEANYFFCSKVSDVPPPKSEELAETAAKDKLVAAVKRVVRFLWHRARQSRRCEARRPDPGFRRQDAAACLGGAGSRRKLGGSLRCCRHVSPAKRPAAALGAKEAGRTQEMTVERPAGVTAVAAAFLLAAAYLLAVGLTMLASPGLVSMAAGAELLGGLELAGPYMFLLMAALGAVIALGLWRLHRWARWLAILVAMIGVVMLLPSRLQRDVRFSNRQTGFRWIGSDREDDDRLVFVPGARGGCIRRELAAISVSLGLHT